MQIEQGTLLSAIFIWVDQNLREERPRFRITFTSGQVVEGDAIKRGVDWLCLDAGGGKPPMFVSTIPVALIEVVKTG